MDSLLLTIFLILTLMVLIYATLPFWMPKVIDIFQKKEKHS